jgi:hypothetical protein
MFIYRYSALGPVRAETRAQSGDWYGSGTLHPGQILRVGGGVVCHCFLPRLDVPTFAIRCPHVRHDARDPRILSGNELTGQCCCDGPQLTLYCGGKGDKVSYFFWDILLDCEMVKVLSCKLHTVLATGVIYSLRNVHYTITQSFCQDGTTVSVVAQEFNIPATKLEYF